MERVSLPDYQLAYTMRDGFKIDVVLFDNGDSSPIMEDFSDNQYVHLPNVNHSSGTFHNRIIDAIECVKSGEGDVIIRPYSDFRELYVIKYLQRTPFVELARLGCLDFHSELKLGYSLTFTCGVDCNYVSKDGILLGKGFTPDCYFFEHHSDAIEVARRLSMEGANLAKKYTRLVAGNRSDLAEFLAHEWKNPDHITTLLAILMLDLDSSFYFEVQQVGVL